MNWRLLLHKSLEWLGLYPYYFYLRNRNSKIRNSAELESDILFYKQFLKPDDLYIDVGANLGNKIDPFLSIGARIVAIDPQPLCCYFLKKRFGNKITVLNKAIGEKAGSGTLFFSGQGSVLASMSQKWIGEVKSKRFSNESWSKEIQVQQIPLSDVFKEYGLPAYCKIDVEGFELPVIKSMNPFPRYFSFEYTVPECLDTLTQCLDYITSKSEASFNFITYENSKFDLPDWVNRNSLLDRIKQLSTTQQGLFGDIYVKCEAAG